MNEELPDRLELPDPPLSEPEVVSPVGAVHSLRGIAGLIGPGLFAWVFSRSIGEHAVIPPQGSPFLLASFLLVLGVGLILWGTRALKPVAAHD